jgi:hypothetical protein
MKLDLEYDRVNAKLKQCSSIVMYGLALDLTTAASSGSEIEAMISNEVSACF